jgi:hypothetical protein
MEQTGEQEVGLVDRGETSDVQDGARWREVNQPLSRVPMERGKRFKTEK